MVAFNPINWEKLKLLADKLAQPGEDPVGVDRSEWQMIEQSLNTLIALQDWKGAIRLREMFSSLVVGDTAGGSPLVQSLNEAAIHAAEQIHEFPLAARFLHDEGHNLHRRGYHKRAIEAFERSASLYRQVGEKFHALESFYMTALCHRALGNRKEAQQILEQILQQVDENDPWRGNPLQVMAWLKQDEGNLQAAEDLLRQALSLYEQYQGPESMLVVQALADLGEVVGLQGRYSEALELFNKSLDIASKFAGQFARQEARTNLKLAELLTRYGEYERALRLLDRADNQIRGYGHYYDLMWRIELARARVCWHQRNFEGVIRNLRMALGYRHMLDLSTEALAKQLVERLRLGAGPPR